MSEPLKVWMDFLDEHGTEKLRDEIRNFLPDDKQLRAALSSTNRRVSEYIRGRAVKEISAKTGIKQKTLRERVRRFSITGSIRNSKIWFGLNDLAFTSLDPVQTGKGVMTRQGRFYSEGAFMQTDTRSGRRMVFRRIGKTWVKNGGKWVHGKLEVPSVNIDEECTKWILQIFRRGDIEEFYFRRLKHELGWRTR